MIYNYEKIKPTLFTEENQQIFLEIRDIVHKLLKEAGVVKMGSIMNKQLGDSWERMACVDRLVELGEIEEIHCGDCAGQDRIFVKVKK